MILVFASDEIELSYRNTNEDHVSESDVLRSIKSCSNVEVLSTRGENSEVAVLDLGQPGPERVCKRVLFYLIMSYETGTRL